MENKIKQGDALLIVDVQNDFIPGGSLPVPDGDRVVPVLNEWIEAAIHAGALVIATRDWHPPDHMSFKERGGPWPPHCVQETGGAAFHPDLKLPQDAIIISKASDPDRDAYSGFQGTELADVLRLHRVRRVWIGGLALDYCVRATAIDALADGFEAHVITPATKPITEETGRQSIEEMQASGAHLEDQPEPFAP